MDQKVQTKLRDPKNASTPKTDQIPHLSQPNRYSGTRTSGSSMARMAPSLTCKSQTGLGSGQLHGRSTKVNALVKFN